MRGTSNSNSRGSAEDRRRRKLWLLAEFGDGKVADCAFGCGAVVDFDTVTVDRWPLAGVDGGRYVRGNIRPACARCNYTDGSERGHAQKRTKRRTVRGSRTLT